MIAFVVIFRHGGFFGEVFFRLAPQAGDSILWSRVCFTGKGEGVARGEAGVSIYVLSHIEVFAISTPWVCGERVSCRTYWHSYYTTVTGFIRFLINSAVCFVRCRFQLSLYFLVAVTCAIN